MKFIMGVLDLYQIFLFNFCQERGIKQITELENFTFSLKEEINHSWPFYIKKVVSY